MDGSEPAAAHALDIAEEPQSTAKPSYELVSLHCCPRQNLSPKMVFLASSRTAVLRPPAASTAAPLCMQTLPITRVKRIIKQDGEVKAISTDANYAIAKAAVSSHPCAVLLLQMMFSSVLLMGGLMILIMDPQEMLLDELVQGAADRTVDGGRNLLSYADVGAELLRRKSTHLSWV